MDETRPRRIVLDTQVWLDWLLFRDASTQAIADAFAAGRLEIVIDAACEAELERAAGYDFGRRSIDAAAQAALLAESRRISTRMELVPDAATKLPRCRDPDDQKFLELALGAKADILISRDRALLELAPKVVKCALPFVVLHPDKFR